MCHLAQSLKSKLRGNRRIITATCFSVAIFIYASAMYESTPLHYHQTPALGIQSYHVPLATSIKPSMAISGRDSRYRVPQHTSSQTEATHDEKREAGIPVVSPTLQSAVPSAVHTTACAADFGTRLGGKSCCGQPGHIEAAQYICPRVDPHCIGYVYGSHFGSCVSVLPPPPPPPTAEDYCTYGPSLLQCACVYVLCQQARFELHGRFRAAGIRCSELASDAAAPRLLSLALAPARGSNSTGTDVLAFVCGMAGDWYYATLTGPALHSVRQFRLKRLLPKMRAFANNNRKRQSKSFFL